MGTIGMTKSQNLVGIAIPVLHLRIVTFGELQPRS